MTATFSSPMPYVRMTIKHLVIGLEGMKSFEELT